MQPCLRAFRYHLDDPFLGIYLKIAGVEDRVCSIKVHEPSNKKTKIWARLKVRLPLMEVSLNYTHRHNHNLDKERKRLHMINE